MWQIRKPKDEVSPEEAAERTEQDRRLMTVGDAGAFATNDLHTDLKVELHQRLLGLINLSALEKMSRAQIEEELALGTRAPDVEPVVGVEAVAVETDVHVIVGSDDAGAAPLRVSPARVQPGADDVRFVVHAGRFDLEIPGIPEDVALEVERKRFVELLRLSEDTARLLGKRRYSFAASGARSAAILGQRRLGRETDNPQKSKQNRKPGRAAPSLGFLWRI